MTEQIVFYSRCKPQGVDAIRIALDNKRIFIGHPMHRREPNGEYAPYDPMNLSSCVVDLSCPDVEWTSSHATSDKRRQFNQNRNLVKKVGVGPIALVPRPSSGLIYAGRVVREFELVNAPPWYDEYMRTRGDEDNSDTRHAADVAQSWEVDKFSPIPVPRVPAWIRRSLFGRSTYGVIHSDPISGNPHEVLCKILERIAFEPRAWTCDPGDIEVRMLEDLTPSAFEHLVVGLLQLEHPNEIWIPVGGSGDDGIDGVGASQEGNVTGLLQCKWQYWGGEAFSSVSVWESDSTPIRRVFATLRYPDGIQPDNCEFLDRPALAKLMIKHRHKLPQAHSMRIGTASESEQ